MVVGTKPKLTRFTIRTRGEEVELDRSDLERRLSAFHLEHGYTGINGQTGTIAPKTVPIDVLKDKERGLYYNLLKLAEVNGHKSSVATVLVALGFESAAGRKREDSKFEFIVIKAKKEGEEDQVKRVLPLKKLRARLKAYKADYTNRTGNNGTSIAIQDMRDNASGIYHQLSLRERALTGHWGPDKILSKLGYDREVVILSDDDIRDILKSLIPRRFAKRCVEGLEDRVEITKLIGSHELGQRVLHATRTKNRKNPKSLRQRIDDLGQEYKLDTKSLYGDLTWKPPSAEEMTHKLTQWYYAGEDISRNGLTQIGGGNRVLRELLKEVNIVEKRREAYQKRKDGRGLFDEPEREPGADEEQAEIQKRRRAKRKIIDSDFNKVIYKHLQGTGITPLEFGINQRSSTMIGFISELEVKLLLEIVATFDPTLEMMGDDFKKYFGRGIKNVHLDRADRQISSSREHAKYADARVRLKGGPEVLVEVKNLRQGENTNIDEIIEKYARTTRWHDQEKISRFLAVLNASEKRIAEGKKKLEERGWQVMTGKEFTGFYRQALEILLNEEPDFFRHTPVQIQTNARRKLERLQAEVYRRPHLLARFGRTYEMDWYKKLLEGAIHALRTKERTKKSEDFKSNYVLSFSEYESIYRDPSKPTRDAESKTIPASYDPIPNFGKSSGLEGVLYLDLETIGLRRKKDGEPEVQYINTIGTAHAMNGEMVVEILFARDPTEEREILLKFKEMVKDYSEIVTYNGQKFDLPYLRERMIAHRIEFDLSQFKHIDIYPFHKKLMNAKKKGEGTLQRCERHEFGIHRPGESDVPGAKIGPAYLAYLRGEDAGRIERILYHNEIDMITLTELDRKYFAQHREHFERFGNRVGGSNGAKKGTTRRKIGPRTYERRLPDPAYNSRNSRSRSRPAYAGNAPF